LKDAKAKSSFLSESALALLHFLAAITWLVLAYHYGWRYEPPDHRSLYPRIAFMLSSLVLLVLWVRQMRRFPGPPSLVETGLACAYVTGVLMREWSDVPNHQLKMVSAAGFVLGVIWLIRSFKLGFKMIRFGWYDWVIIGGIIVFPLIIFMWIPGFSAHIGVVVFSSVAFTLMLGALVVVIRPLVGYCMKNYGKEKWTFRPGVLVRWLIFPLALVLMMKYGKYVSALKVQRHSWWLLDTAERLPAGNHGKIAGFMNLDRPLAYAGSIRIHGISKTKDTITFVTAVDDRGITYGYIHAPDDVVPKAGTGQVIRKLRKQWWKFAPANPSIH
jgi:hypothetical protein